MRETKQIRLSKEQWEKVHRVASYAATDPFYNVRDTLVRLYESWGYTEADAIANQLLAPLPQIREGMKGSRRLAP